MTPTPHRPDLEAAPDAVRAGTEAIPVTNVAAASHLDATLLAVTASGGTIRDVVRLLRGAAPEGREDLLATLAGRFGADPVGTCQGLWEAIRPEPGDRRPWDGVQEGLDRIRGLGIDLHPLSIILGAETSTEARRAAGAMLGPRSPWIRLIQSSDRLTALTSEGRDPDDLREITAWPETLRVLPCEHIHLRLPELATIPCEITAGGLLMFAESARLEAVGGLLTAREVNLRGCVGLRRLGGIDADCINLNGCAALEALPAGIRTRWLNIAGCEALAALPDDLVATTLVPSRRLGGVRATAPLPQGITWVRTRMDNRVAHPGTEA
jgi:hypothetical protein